VLAGWTISLFAQFILGGLVAGTISGMVCTEFPTCTGGIWFPTFLGPVGLQVIHRLNAYLLVSLALTLLWLCRSHAGLRGTTRALLALVLGQATVGAINVLTLLPPAVTTAHSVFAALLFSVTALLWHRALASRTR
jgi:cytochrome c oxidase assembly protein subunit 15